MQGRFGAVDIAVAPHRDANGVFHFGNRCKIDPRRIHFFPCAPMHHHQRGTGLLTGFGHLHGGFAVIVPAGAHFHTHRPFARILYHGFYDLPAKRRIQHQPAARAVVYDLGRRAAHIDIIKIKILARNACRSLSHAFGIAAKQLHPVGHILRAVFPAQQLQRFAVIKAQRLGADHFTYGKTGPVPGHQPTGSSIAESGHGGKRRARAQGYGSKFHVCFSLYHFH